MHGWRDPLRRAYKSGSNTGSGTTVSQLSLRRPSRYCASATLARSQLTTAMTVADALRIPVGASITAGKLSYDRAVTVQQLPPIRPYSHLKRICRARARQWRGVRDDQGFGAPRSPESTIAQADSARSAWRESSGCGALARLRANWPFPA